MSTSTSNVEQAEDLLEQEKLAPLKILVQHLSKSLTSGLEQNPELELLGEVDLQTAREKAGAGADFDSINFKMVSGSLKTAQESGADVLFFTNEQQDQLGVCAKKGIEGNLLVLTPHQIALLVTEILIEEHHRQKADQKGDEADENAKDPLILRSIVLTDAFEVQAAYRNVKSIQTYSGLEEMSAAIKDNEQAYTILAAVDEANHLLFPGLSPLESVEKGISLLAEKALALKKQGKTLMDFLVSLYRQYGFYHEKSFTINREDKDGEKLVKSIVSELRKLSPDSLFGKPVRLVNDFNKGTFNNHLTSKKGKTSLPKADILQFIFADNTKITIIPAEDYNKLFYHFSVSSRIAGMDAFDEAKTIANSQIMRMMERIGKI